MVLSVSWSPHEGGHRHLDKVLELCTGEGQEDGHKLHLDQAGQSREGEAAGTGDAGAHLPGKRLARDLQATAQAQHPDSPAGRCGE